MRNAVGLAETEGQKGSDEQGMDEQSEDLPSSYCTMYAQSPVLLHLCTNSPTALSTMKWSSRLALSPSRARPSLMPVPRGS